jgi:hypothetical protein
VLTVQATTNALHLSMGNTSCFSTEARTDALRASVSTILPSHLNLKDVPMIYPKNPLGNVVKTGLGHALASREEIEHAQQVTHKICLTCKEAGRPASDYERPVKCTACHAEGCMNCIMSASFTGYRELCGKCIDEWKEMKSSQKG